MLKHRVRRIEALRKRCGGDRPRGPAQPPPRPLQTAQDLINLLEEQVEALRAAAWAGTVSKARAIGYLAEIARKTLETGKLASRLEMLELVLKERKGETPR
jgi:hypothetical protein